MTGRPAPRTARGLVAAVVATLIALTGACGTDQDNGQETDVDPRTELLARPSLEQATEHYRQMQQRVQDAVESVIGSRTWTVDDAPGTDGCGFGRFADIQDAQSLALPRAVFTGGIGDAEWPRVAGAIDTVLREYGFSTEGLVTMDRNGMRVISGIEPATGATFSFRSENNTLVRITTGCHLPEDRKVAS